MIVISCTSTHLGQRPPQIQDPERVLLHNFSQGQSCKMVPKHPKHDLEKRKDEKWPKAWKVCFRLKGSHRKPSPAGLLPLKKRPGHQALSGVQPKDGEPRGSSALQTSPPQKNFFENRPRGRHLPTAIFGVRLLGVPGPSWGGGMGGIPGAPCVAHRQPQLRAHELLRGTAQFEARRWKM